MRIPINLANIQCNSSSTSLTKAKARDGQSVAAPKQTDGTDGLRHGQKKKRGRLLDLFLTQSATCVLWKNFKRQALEELIKQARS